MLLLFFFFKQKTAYEVRISDWSSDVCSSDLRALLRCVAAILVPDRVADGLQQQLIAGAAAQQFAQWFPGGGKQAGVKLAGCSDAQAVAACTEWIADGRDHTDPVVVVDPIARGRIVIARYRAHGKPGGQFVENLGFAEGKGLGWGKGVSVRLDLGGRVAI